MEPSKEPSSDVKSQLAELKRKIADNETTSPYKDILDDDLLLGFLRGKKYKVKAAFDCLLCSIQVRTQKYPGFTQNCIPATLGALQDHNTCKLLRQRDPKGYNILLWEARLWDPHTHNAQQVVAEVVLKFDEITRSYSNHSPNNNCVALMDVLGANFAHARHISPGIFKQILDFLQNTYPGRPVAIHYVNAGWLVRSLFNIARPMIKKKIRDRIHFHSSDMSTLHEHLSPDILPVSLGGCLTEQEAFDETLDTKLGSRQEFYDALGERS